MSAQMIALHRAGKPVLINAAHIVWVQPHEDVEGLMTGDSLVLTIRGQFRVTESFAEISAELRNPT